MWKRLGMAATAAAVALAMAGCTLLGIQKLRGVEYILRVNAGTSEPYTDKAGHIWQPEKMYTKGGGYGFVGDEANCVDRGTDVKIGGTDDPRIYQLERWLMDKFIAEVPNGRYTVRLHFAETYPNIDTDGPRIFDVKVQDKVVLKDFNVQKVAGGFAKAYIKTCEGVEVTNGLLEISFLPNQQNPEINGIEILSE